LADCNSSIENPYAVLLNCKGQVVLQSAYGLNC
jgi:hypothetical protein